MTLYCLQLTSRQTAEYTCICECLRICKQPHALRAGHTSHLRLPCWGHSSDTARTLHLAPLTVSSYSPDWCERASTRPASCFQTITRLLWQHSDLQCCSHSTICNTNCFPGWHTAADLKPIDQNLHSNDAMAYATLTSNAVWTQPHRLYAIPIRGPAAGMRNRASSIAAGQPGDALPAEGPWLVLPPSLYGLLPVRAQSGCHHP